jgi:hypothetical protein
MTETPEPTDKLDAATNVVVNGPADDPPQFCERIVRRLPPSDLNGLLEPDALKGACPVPRRPRVQQCARGYPTAAEQWLGPVALLFLVGGEVVLDRNCVLHDRGLHVCDAHNEWPSTGHQGSPIARSPSGRSSSTATPGDVTRCPPSWASRSATWRVLAGIRLTLAAAWDELEQRVCRQR